MPIARPVDGILKKPLELVYDRFIGPHFEIPFAVAVAPDKYPMGSAEATVSPHP
jgi:hypothetical protein